MWHDLARVCRAQGIPLRRPSQVPRNGLLAARVACAGAAERAAWLPVFVRAVYAANFAEDRDIADAGVLRDCLARAGAPVDAALARAASDDTKARLRAQNEEAVRLGIFGAPTFVVDGELFWGNDRLEAAFAVVASAGERGHT
jgi:2-hydroxychromene-2-carboxylate isomerase